MATKRKYNKKKKSKTKLENFMAEPGVIQKPKSYGLIPIIIFSLIGGIIGSLGYIHFFPDTSTEIDTTDTPVAIPAEPKTQNLKISPQLLLPDTNELHDSVIGIYKKKNITKNTTELNKLYTSSDLIGQGFVLTSDGWIATSAEHFKKNTSTNLVARTSDKNIFELSEPIIDELTNTALIKIDAQNLAVTHFEEVNKLNQLDPVFTINSSHDVQTSTVAHPMFTNYASSTSFIQSSDTPSYSIKLNSSFDTSMYGSPVFSYDEHIIGFVSGEKTITPIYFVTPILKQVFKGEEIQRTTLGVHYVDLSQAPGFMETELTRGAYIYGTKQLPAVITKSPAALAELQEGDIITKIDNEEINEKHSLASIIQDYPLGSDITATILRDDLEQKIKITL